MANILIIEDDPEVTENLGEILLLQNFSVLTANNGKKGVEMAFKELPDLIICDITMPEMDGYEVLKNIRKNPATFATPLIFLTAKTEKSDQRLGMELGADDYITKPFDNKEILTAINTRLTKHTQSKEFYETKLEELRYNISSTIPHELRTPLNTILGFIQILQSSYKELTDREITMMHNSIFEAGKRLLRLIINYTFYTKLLSGSGESAASEEKHVSYTSGILKSQSVEIANTYNRINDIRINLADAPISIPESSFIKIVDELVDNAFKFSEPGTPVSVISQIVGNHYVLEVMNQGRGMTPQQINNIGAFLQFDRKEYEQQGSGLGLAITKKLLELNNGSMEIISHPGIDITFRISLLIS